jgi:hypothetical protein
MIFAYHMQRYARFLKTVRRWGKSVKDEKVLSVLRSEQVKMGLESKTFAVKICDFISSSMLTGFFRPMILLPQKDFETDEQEFIFRHELIHYKRRDLPAKLRFYRSCGRGGADSVFGFRFRAYRSSAAGRSAVGGEPHSAKFAAVVAAR